MATRKGTQYVSGTFQYRPLVQEPVNTLSPWLSKVRIVPTTSAVRSDLLSIGQCRREHSRHLATSLCVDLPDLKGEDRPSTKGPGAAEAGRAACGNS